MLHEWFVEMFPETGAWFVARLRYTRSCAVMSMVGYVLGYVESVRVYRRTAPTDLTVGWVTDTGRIFCSKREQAGFYMLISTVYLTRYGALSAT